MTLICQMWFKLKEKVYHCLLPCCLKKITQKFLVIFFCFWEKHFFFYSVSMTWQFIKYYNCRIICLFQSIQFSRSIQSHTHTHVQTEAAFIPEGQEQLLSSTCMQSHKFRAGRESHNQPINSESRKANAISSPHNCSGTGRRFIKADWPAFPSKLPQLTHSAILLTTPSTHINQNTEGNLYETVQKRKCKMCHSVRIKADGYERKIESAYIKKIIIYHCGVIPENMFLEITGNVLIKDKVKGNASYEVC